MQRRRAAGSLDSAEAMEDRLEMMALSAAIYMNEREREREIFAFGTSAAERLSFISSAR